MKIEPIAMSAFHKLRGINVNEHTEKKNGLTYLSWAWAVDQLLLNDPAANWEYLEPMRFGETMMVRCAVTAFGKTMTAQLPVMDHRNKPIPNPDAFQVNTAMQRCLAKAIALHGLGLYIYAGEDLPQPDQQQAEQENAKHLEAYRAAAMNGLDALRKHHSKHGKEAGKAFWDQYADELKQAAQQADAELVTA